MLCGSHTFGCWPCMSGIDRMYMNRLTVKTADPREPYAAKLRRTSYVNPRAPSYRFVNHAPAPPRYVCIVVHYPPKGSVATQIVCDESAGEDELELLERMARHRHLVIIKQPNGCNSDVDRTETTAQSKQNGLEDADSEKAAGGGRGGKLRLACVGISHVDVRPNQLG